MRAFELREPAAILDEALAAAVAGLGAEGGSMVESEAAVARGAISAPVGELGSIEVHGPGERTFTDADAAFLEALAGVAVAAIRRAQADADARANEERLQAALEAAGMGAYDVNLDDGTVVISRGFARIFNEDPFRLRLRRDEVFEKLHPEDRDRVSRETTDWHARGGDTELEYRIVRPDGSVRWLVATARIVVNSDGVRHVLGVTRDVTERREAEHVLRKTAALQDLMVENSTDLLALVALDGTPVYVSPSCEKMLGYSVGELLDAGLTAFDLVDPLDLEEVAAGVMRARGAGLNPPVLFRMKSKAGDWLELEGLATAIPGEAGDEELLLVAARDVTQQHRVVAELAQLESRSELLLASVGEGVISVDHAGRVTHVNPAALDLLGYKSEFQLLGKDLHATTHHTRADGTPYPAEECPLRGALAGEAVRGTDEVFWRADGSSFPIEYTAAPIRAGDQTVGVVEVFTDVEERKRLEADLLQAQKMESLGQLAGGIAHDFNNMLLAVRAFGELALRKLDRSEDGAAADVEEMLLASGRATDLTRKLLAFAKRQFLNPIVLDLNDAIREMESLLRAMLGGQVELAVFCGEAPVLVLADIGQFDQVLTNLAVNARDAMPDGGRLTIEVEPIELRGQLGRRGPHALITVADTGLGMDARTMAQVFEPFFTTKGASGTGLGLATVHGIVEQSGGVIRVDSTPGEGTTFQIYLPLAPAPSDAVDPDDSNDGDTILLVDDDESVLAAVRAMLLARGYSVLVASGGAEALMLLAGHPEPGALLLMLTDIVMPGLDGVELAKRARTELPGLRVLFMSGQAGTAALADLGDPLTGYLHKPFSGDELERCVRALFEPAAA